MNDTQKNILLPQETESLINEVFLRPVLWDSTSKAYKDTVLKKAAWKELAFLFKVDVNIIQTRWKSLRDKYVRERKKEGGKSGQAAEPGRIKFRFLSSMQFLNKCSESVPTVTNMMEMTHGQSTFDSFHMKVNSLDSQVAQLGEIEIPEETEQIIISDDVCEESQVSLSSRSNTVSPDPLSPAFPPTLGPKMQFFSPPGSPALSNASDSSTFCQPTAENKREKARTVPDACSTVSNTTEDQILSLLKQHQEDKARSTTKELTPEEHYYLAVAARVSKLSFRNRIRLEQMISETLAKMYEEEGLF